MRIVFIGCVKFSAATLGKLLTLKDRNIQVVGVVTKSRSQFNSDFVSLQPIAKKNKIPCLLADHLSPTEMTRQISALAPDVIYCFGWSHLIGPDILNIPLIGAIGYHPAQLPANRGRHPIIWTLALGLTQTASTFFFMDKNADSGDILSQKTVFVSEKDDAGSLYEKLTAMAQKQILHFTKQLARGHVPRIKQEHRLANSWRKRTDADGKIDWRMSATSIFNLIRALSSPYPGAFCEFRGNRVKVHRAMVCRSEEKNLEPGKVLSVTGKTITVKCGEQAIKLLAHDFRKLPVKGECL